MKTIPLPAGAAYVCVADLLRWIRQTGQDGFWDVYVSDAGEFELRPRGCAPFKNEMKAQFIAFCKREMVEPTSQFDRWEKNYTGEGLQDGVYEVTVSEAERFASPFGLSFQVDVRLATESASDGVGVDSPDWRMQIQAEAYECWLRLRALGCNPTVHSICENMARWCTDQNIKGGKGQNPRAGTIRNTVLGAGHWTPPNHSVVEAKRHVEQIARTAQTEVA